MSLPLLSLRHPVFQAPAGEQGGGGQPADARPRSALSLPPIEDIAREVVPPHAEAAAEDPELAPVADAFVRDALAAGEDARAPKRGAGLVLSIPGGQPTRIIDASGRLTPGGRYFYEKREVEPPQAGIDRTAAPTLNGSRLVIKLLNGRTSTVRSWDGIDRRWRFTALGKK